MLLENPRFSIVTPVRDDVNIRTFCESLPFLKGFPDIEVLIMRDIASTSEVKQTTDKFAVDNPNVRIIELPEGPIARRNQGIKETKGERVVFLDSDVTVNRHFFTAINDTVENHPDIDVIVPRLLRMEGETTLQRLISIHFTRLSKWERPPVNNPGLVIRRKVFEEIGLLDENLPHGDDYDFNKRIRNRDTVFTRKAVVFHAADSPKKFFRQSFKYGIDRSRVSRKLDRKNRLGIIKDRAKALVFFPYFMKDLSRGIEMATFEGAKSMVSAAGFWYQEAKTFIDNLTSQRKRSSV